MKEWYEDGPVFHPDHIARYYGSRRTEPKQTHMKLTWHRYINTNCDMLYEAQSSHKDGEGCNFYYRMRRSYDRDTGLVTWEDDSDAAIKPVRNEPWYDSLEAALWYEGYDQALTPKP